MPLDLLPSRFSSHTEANHSDKSLSVSPQESPPSPLSISCTIHSNHTFGASPPSAHASHLGSPFSTTSNLQTEPSNPSPCCITLSTPHHNQSSTIQQQRLQPSRSFLDMHPSPYSMIHDLPRDDSLTRLVEAEACASLLLTLKLRISLTISFSFSAIDYYQKACIASAMDCEYWQKEYRQLFRSHRQVEERAAILEKRCKELEQSLQVTLREQRRASREALLKSADVNHKRTQTIPRPIRRPPPSLNDDDNSNGCTLGLQKDRTQIDGSIFQNNYSSNRHPFSFERSRQSTCQTIRSTSQAIKTTKDFNQYDSFSNRSRSEGNIDQWSLDEASQDSSCNHPYNNQSWK